jgi:hypothetical protein
MASVIEFTDAFSSSRQEAGTHICRRNEALLAATNQLVAMRRDEPIYGIPKRERNQTCEHRQSPETSQVARNF